MSATPSLQPEQFERIRSTFRELIRRDLRGDAARAFLAEHAGGDEAVAGVLDDMLRAHESEPADGEDTAAGFHARAVEAVLDATRHAGEEIEQHVPERIGPYRVIRFVAAGGMSTVYEAEQEEPRRRVAIKVIRYELLTENSIRRFEDEGHLLARLRHPGIARVLSMGRMPSPAGTVPYLVLEYIDGVPIDSYVRTQALDVRERVALLRQVARAVQYAHDNGVMHRDLKPGNVLVDREGKAHVLDFGIGRNFDEDLDQASRTASGLFLGTLAYMSPEQAVRTETPLDVRVDVYGVGAVGYDLLCGRAPHDVKDLPLHRALERVAHRSPTAPEQHDPALAGDLSAILSKSLATDPARRYRSVRDLDADLRRFLAFEPVEARPPSRLYLASKLIRRHRTTFALLALLLVSLLAGLVVSLTQRANALDATARATQLAQEAEHDRRAARLEATWLAVEEERILEVAEAVTPFLAEPKPHYLEHRLLEAHTRNATRLVDIEYLGLGDALRFSRDGRQACARDAAGRLLHLDLRSGQARPLRAGTAPWDGDDFTTTWSMTRPAWLLIHTESTLFVVDATSGEVIRQIDAQSPEVSFEASPEAAYALWVRRERSPRLVDLVRGVRVTKGEIGRAVQAGAAMHDPRYVELGGRRTLDLHTGLVEAPRTASRRGHGARDPSGTMVVRRGQRPVLDWLTTGESWRIPVHQGLSSTAHAFSADGRYVALLYWDGSTQVWDIAARRLVRTLWDTRIVARSNRPGTVRHLEGGSVQFIGPERVRTVCHGYIAEWQLGRVAQRYRHARPDAAHPYVYRMQWHPESRFLASAAWDGHLVMWDAWAGREVWRFDVHRHLTPEHLQQERGLIIPTNLGFSPDGRLLMVRLNRGTWLVVDWSARRIITQSTPRRSPLGLTNDGVYVQAANERGFEILPLDSPRLQEPLPEGYTTTLPAPWLKAIPAQHAAAGTYTRSGSRFAHPKRRPGYASRSYEIWDEDGSAWSGTISAEALCTALVDNGARLLVGTRDGTLHLVDTDTRRRLLVLHGHEDYVITIAAAPDKSAVAAGSGDGWIQIWPTRTPGEQLQQLQRVRDQDARLAPLVRDARAAGGDLAAQRERLLADPRLEEDDRTAALVRLVNPED